MDRLHIGLWITALIVGACSESAGPPISQADLGQADALAFADAAQQKDAQIDSAMVADAALPDQRLKQDQTVSKDGSASICRDPKRWSCGVVSATKDPTPFWVPTVAICISSCTSAGVSAKISCDNNECVCELAGNTNICGMPPSTASDCGLCEWARAAGCCGI
ncbi:MAG: hypothetical protein H6707_09540 [Deltaproteobacteria bacterium]|nr:hypothetical protein [Deltaproteobacteria bacterium]